MKYEIYSVFDTKVGAFGNPVFFRSKGEALRTLTDACNDPKSDLGRHAGDYVLHRVGSWDDTNARLESMLEPVIVLRELMMADLSEVKATSINKLRQEG